MSLLQVMFRASNLWPKAFDDAKRVLEVYEQELKVSCDTGPLTASEECDFRRGFELGYYLAASRAESGEEL